MDAYNTGAQDMASGGGSGGGIVVALYAGSLSNSGTLQVNGGAGGTAIGGRQGAAGGAGYTTLTQISA
jgi:hypothetical protein